MLYLKDLTIQRGNKIVFSDFNTIIKSGSITLIKGKNGSGKSTLLRTINRLTDATSGEILFQNQNLSLLKQKLLLITFLIRWFVDNI